MKRICVIIFLCASLNSSFGQIAKGTRVPAGAINLYGSRTTVTDSMRKNLNRYFQNSIGLNYGKFIKENLLLSFGIGYTLNWNRSSTEYKTLVNNPILNNKSFEILQSPSINLSIEKFHFLNEKIAISYGASLRLYFEETRVNRNFWFPIYNPALNTTTHEERFYNSYNNKIGTLVNLNTSLHYFITKKLSLSGSIGYCNFNYSYLPYSKQKFNITEHVFTFQLIPNFNNFNIGLTYYIQPKRKAK